MVRKHASLLAVVALVLLAGCAGFATTGSTDGSSDSATDPARTIEIVATGDATADPDRATVRVSVQATGSDAEAVREELASDDEALLAALRNWGLADEQIRTVRYDVRETRDSREKTETTQYVGIHTYALEIHQVDAVGEVIDVAVANGADEVDRVQFGLSENRTAEVRERALENAMGNAERDATTIADSSGLELVGVFTASTADTRTIRAEYAVAAREGGDAATNVEPGDVSVEVRVRVVYEAAEDGS